MASNTKPKSIFNEEDNQDLPFINPADVSADLSNIYLLTSSSKINHKHILDAMQRKRIETYHRDVLCDMLATKSAE
jgi:hypothetical protein